VAIYAATGHSFTGTNASARKAYRCKFSLQHSLLLAAAKYGFCFTCPLFSPSSFCSAAGFNFSTNAHISAMADSKTYG
jgi:hypothetical protein